MREPVTTGAVLSILTTGEVKLAVFPARSVTSMLPDTEPPSADRTSGLGTLVVSTLDSFSALRYADVTSVLVQSWMFATGEAAPNVSDGVVLSMLIPEAV